MMTVIFYSMDWCYVSFEIVLFILALYYLQAMEEWLFFSIHRLFGWSRKGTSISCPSLYFFIQNVYTFLQIYEGVLLLLLSCFSCVQLYGTPQTGSPSGSLVPRILQARTLEWVAISFSSAWKWKVTVKSLSRFQLLATPWTAAHQAPPSMGFSRQEYWSGVPLPYLIWGSILCQKQEIGFTSFF